MTHPIRRIVYVEDEPDIREITTLALTRIGDFTVTVCVSGADMLKRAPAAQPDLILMDMMMPDMDGLETLARMREDPALARTPVIFMTAKAQPEEVRRYHAAGVAGVVRKPYDPLRLVDEIMALVEGARPAAAT